MPCDMRGGRLSARLPVMPCQIKGLLPPSGPQYTMVGWRNSGRGAGESHGWGLGLERGLEKESVGNK